MSAEEKNKIIINNYYCFPFEILQELLNQRQLFPSGNNQENNIAQNIFLNKKRENPEAEIDKQEIDNGSNDLEEKKEDNNTSIKENKNITIQINNKPKNKFISKKNYFSINNNKKVGRKPKSSVIKGYHTKFSHDNILRKIKVYFFKKLVKYINNLILMKYKDKVKLLTPLTSNISQNNKKSFNRELLNQKLKEVFSNYKINGKFRSFDENYNKIVIKNIYDENITELIDILEMTLLEVYKIFRDSNERQKLVGLEKLDKVIEELQVKESEEYMIKFKKVAMNFENYYFKKKMNKSKFI